MKPTKNIFFCRDSGRKKMLFKTKKNADTFIKFNKREIEEESGYCPQRSYFCLFCNGWHTTSKAEGFGKSRNEYLFEKYQQEKLLRNSSSKRGKAERLIEERLETLTEKLHKLPIEEIKLYLAENIKQLNSDIEELCKSGKKANEEKIKDLRYDLQVLYLIRKQKGFKK